MCTQIFVAGMASITASRYWQLPCWWEVNVQHRQPDHRRGIHRRRAGRGFVYEDARGRVIQGEALQRIKSLSIPPAWQEVWVNPSATAHLQAVGRDDRHRKQYLYHPHWRAARDQKKFQRILRFAQVLPAMRRRLRREVKARGLGFDKVLAAVVSLLDCSLIRVGNREYVRQNGSYGLTTLEDKHVTVSPATVRFEFRGKSKRAHSIEVKDARLARIVRDCRAQPGRHLFQYRDDTHKVRKVTATEVNRYLRELSHAEFSAKDFRTWSATVLMIAALGRAEEAKTVSLRRSRLKACLSSVAERLGNTPAVCRKSYIPPVVLETYLRRPAAVRFHEGSTPKIRGLHHAEMRAYAVLERLMRTK